MSNKALVLIDIQNIYFTEGDLKTFKPEEASKNAGRLLEECRKKGIKVIHVGHVFGDTKNYSESRKMLNDFHEYVQPLENESIVSKVYPDSFHRTKLEEILKENDVDEIIFAGIMSHMCIDTSVRSAFIRGYKAKVAHDACTTMNLKFNGETLDASVVHKVIMSSLNGVFADVLSTDDIINTL